MKLQKQLSRKVGNTEYAKWVIVIPLETIKELEWKEGQDLETEIKDKKLTIKKS
jgi:antitoxin component of MazEF toxin-antitoxin module